MDDDIVHIKDIQNRIFTIRGLQVMVDSDLANLYGVQVKRLNEQVKRNKDRFPKEFMFQLTDEEWTDLRSQIATSSWGGKRKLPYVFTEQGVAMLSAVLRSETAVKVSIKIMQAFIEMKRFIATNAAIFRRIEKIELKQKEADEKFDEVFKALEDKSITPKQGVFFAGEVYDAYSFVSDLIRSARDSLILIDNYIDDTVLTMFAKRKRGVSFTVLTRSISKQFQLDLNKHNQQYPEVKAMIFRDAHDRFLIIDEKEIYHFGASLKDLAKKWFAFSKLDVSSVKVLDRLREMGIVK